MPDAEKDAAIAMRYSIHRWAPTQPTPSLDYVLWLRETLPPEDLFELGEALTELAHAAEEHHQTRIAIAYVTEEIMRRLAWTRGLPPGGPDA
jgi:hypothetical protein